jgi:hypothetical protein
MNQKLLWVVQQDHITWSYQHLIVFYSNTLEIHHPNEIFEHGRQALSSNLLEGFKEIKSSKMAQHLKDHCGRVCF